jgi:hypothetical protein
MVFDIVREQSFINQSKRWVQAVIHRSWSFTQYCFQYKKSDSVKNDMLFLIFKMENICVCNKPSEFNVLYTFLAIYIQ